MAASRFPGKPLVPIAGTPLVLRVLDAARGADALARVVVATPDDAVEACVSAHGGEVIRTRDDHETGTDRVAEVARRLPGYDVVVNIQGDQPLVTAAMLAALVAPFAEPDPPTITTLAAPLDATRGPDDPNTVKVVCDIRGNALYFSRSPIPYDRNSGPPLARHHIGLYAFARDFLATYAGLAPTALEQREGLEQLRVLEHGYRIRVCECDRYVAEVNAPEDVPVVEAVLTADGANEGNQHV
jgi:3-deoxy-manno-octulosonate cytidylyltransferase (CMP-KDO synthetase)